jgi:hypothetical protein
MVWLMMRDAALLRHWMLVCALYPPGPQRAAAWSRHVAVVRAFYGF